MENSYKEILKEYDEDKIKKMLIGRRVRVKDDETLELDNGIILKIVPNSGCAGCGSGDYSIKELNNVDNAITNVEFAVDENTEDEVSDTSYKIFVFCEDTRIKLLQIDGSDGNGWYGTGYEIIVLDTLEDLEK